MHCEDDDAVLGRRNAGNTLIKRLLVSDEVYKVKYSPNAEAKFDKTEHKVIYGQRPDYVCVVEEDGEEVRRIVSTQSYEGLIHELVHAYRFDTGLRSYIGMPITFHRGIGREEYETVGLIQLPKEKFEYAKQNNIMIINENLIRSELNLPIRILY